jgi:hypothetical protein
MPNTKYETMVSRARSINCEAFTDLPALLCNVCGHCVSFGGIEHLQEQQYEEWDVCYCSEEGENTLPTSSPQTSE